MDQTRLLSPKKKIPLNFFVKIKLIFESFGSKSIRNRVVISSPPSLILYREAVKCEQRRKSIQVENFCLQKKRRKEEFEAMEKEEEEVTFGSIPHFIF